MDPENELPIQYRIEIGHFSFTYVIMSYDTNMHEHISRSLVSMHLRCSSDVFMVHYVHNGFCTFLIKNKRLPKLF